MPRLLTRPVLLRLIVCLLLLAGLFRDAVAAVQGSEFVYFPTAKGDILAFELSLDGKLTALSPPRDRIHVTEYPIDLIAHSSGQFIYAATINDPSHQGSIYTFRVQPDGGLEAIGAPLRVTPSIGQIVFRPGSKLLYAVKEDNAEAGKSRNVSTFLVGENGQLSELPPTLSEYTFRLGQPAGCEEWSLLSFTNDGKHAFLFTYYGMIDEAVRELYLYRVGAQGALTKEREITGNEQEYQPHGNPRAFGPVIPLPHHHIAIVNNPFAGELPVMDISAAGRLSPHKAAHALHVSEDLWEPFYDPKTRQLGPLHPTGKRADTRIRYRAIDPLGRFVYIDVNHLQNPHIAPANSRTFRTYRIDKAGALHLAYESPYRAAQGQSGMEICVGADPSGNFLVTYRHLFDTEPNPAPSPISVFGVDKQGRISTKPLASVDAADALRSPIFVLRH